jgi:hypothetical protein
MTPGTYTESDSTGWLCVTIYSGQWDEYEIPPPEPPPYDFRPWLRRDRPRRVLPRRSQRRKRLRGYWTMRERAGRR